MFLINGGWHYHLMIELDLFPCLKTILFSWQYLSLFFFHLFSQKLLKKVHIEKRILSTKWQIVFLLTVLFEISSFYKQYNSLIQRIKLKVD